MAWWPSGSAHFPHTQRWPIPVGIPRRSATAIRTELSSKRFPRVETERAWSQFLSNSIPCRQYHEALLKTLLPFETPRTGSGGSAPFEGGPRTSEQDVESLPGCQCLHGFSKRFMDVVIETRNRKVCEKRVN